MTDNDQAESDMEYEELCQRQLTAMVRAYIEECPPHAPIHRYDPENPTPSLLMLLGTNLVNALVNLEGLRCTNAWINVWKAQAELRAKESPLA